VVGMAVGDDGFFHRLCRVDMKAAALAAHAGRRRQQKVFGTHQALDMSWRPFGESAEAEIRHLSAGAVISALAGRI
jgi:hypothetical protein